MEFKNLFTTKFSPFLHEEKDFFIKNKKQFLINFLQLIKKNFPQTPITKDTKQIITNFYDALFINISLKQENFKPLIEIKHFFTNNRIEIRIINKLFLLMINQYIKYIFPSSNLEKVKTLTLLLDFYYTLLNTKIEIESFSDTFPPILEKLYKEKLPLIIFGVYKGIPISNKSRILSINKQTNSIKVNGNNYQLIASKFQKEIYLLDPNSNKTFKAIVKDVIFYKKILILSDIKEIKRESLKRNYIRVQPKKPQTATIEVNNTKYKGIIYDISIKGISIITKNSIPLNINETAYVNFKLNNEFTFLAELKSISHFNKKYRYHFFFNPTPSQEEKLEDYITKREKEIIKELTTYLNKEFIEI